MIQSLLIKLSMLAMTMGVVFWIGWQAPQVSLKPAALVESPIVTPITAESELIVPDRRSGGSASLNTRAANSHVLVDETARRGLLDLNRAGPEDFQSLPGIGPVLAERIMVYRKSNGGFRTVDELRQVKGIGQKKFTKVRPLVTVTAPGTKGRTEKPLS
ncbi:MAG: helix-hairpin-helix domain-containing protein [Nitrospirae bacterium]|nr:helix-hairpin-helix domain-containing protein [Nitrospirota bacterium]